MNNKFLAFLLAYCVAAPLLAGDKLPEILAGSHRPAEHKARDKYRHPLETLEFFGVKDDMTVVEIWPGKDGWYTEILAPYLKDKGKLYAAHFSPNADSEYRRNGLAAFSEKIKAQADLYGKVELTVLHPPAEVQIAPENSADRVLTFRNTHNWMKEGQAETVFKAMFKALKPGGILGIVEHRGDASKAQDPQAVSGYVREDYVIKLAEDAGFKLKERSEINANKKDTKDYPEGVWTLPPALRLKDQDRQKYLDIGESDRMTLTFFKPEAKD
jgi:predicted methyltransferase